MLIRDKGRYRLQPLEKPCPLGRLMPVVKQAFIGEAVDHVVKVARSDPACSHVTREPRRRLGNLVGPGFEIRLAAWLHPETDSDRDGISITHEESF
jgi:hypothetical protein